MRASIDHPTRDEAEAEGSALCVYATAGLPRRLEGENQSLTRRSTYALTRNLDDFISRRLTWSFCLVVTWVIVVPAAVHGDVVALMPASLCNALSFVA